MNFIVLASGRGSRLNILTKKKPKCLTEIKNKKTLLDFIVENFNNNDNKIISIGYKSNLITKHLSDKSVIFVKNKNFLSTNMTESLMLCKKKLKKKDLIIVYSDIYFDQVIIKKIRKLKGNIIALNSNWLNSWKQRYLSLKKIKEDAENCVVSKGKIKKIGHKIGKKLPKYQFMGIIKIEYKTFSKLENFYKRLKNKKISMTHFLNESIKFNITNYKYFDCKNYWYEVDNISDLNYLKKMFNQHSYLN